MQKPTVNKQNSSIIFERIMFNNGYRFDLDKSEIKDDIYECYIVEYGKEMERTPFDNQILLAKRHFNELYKNYLFCRNK